LRSNAASNASFTLNLYTGKGRISVARNESVPGHVGPIA
jgi:hypothetical protein